MLTVDSRTARPCPLSLHVASFILIAALPSASLYFSLGPRSACLVAALVALPRLSWRRGQQEDAFFVAVLALYWNLVMLICFGSPLLLAMAMYFRPGIFVTLTWLWILWSRLLFPSELSDGAGWKFFAMREWGFHIFRCYLKLRLHVSGDLYQRPANKPVILAVHPHGVASDYRILMDGMLYDALPGRKVLSLSATVLFWLPVVRELAVWTRCIDARKSVASRALRQRHSLMVLPGGEAEQMRTREGREEVYLQKRLGFVKLALEQGAALVPCYAFGTVDLYSVYEVLRGPRQWLQKRFGICIPVYHGHLGFLPKRKPVDVVLGQPLEYECATPGSPTEEEVKNAHAAYIAALTLLFNTHKERFGYGDRQLHVC